MGKNTTEASLPDKNRFIVCGNAKQSPVTAGKSKTAGEKNRITLSRGDKEKLRSLFDNMLACQDGKPMSAENLAAVAGVLDIIEKNRVRTEPSVGISARLGEILEYADNNFGGDCSVNMLCEKFFISRSSLYRAFRDELDITPSKYIENRRLANAKKLLERGESVQAAAEKSGFPDYSHFISLFKKRFGTTPKKYQRVSLRQAKIAAF